MLELTVMISNKPGKYILLENTINIANGRSTYHLVKDWVRSKIEAKLMINPDIYDHDYRAQLAGLLVYGKTNTNYPLESYLLGGLVKMTLLHGELPSMFEKIVLTPDLPAGNPVIAEILIREKGHIVQIYNVKRNRNPHEVWAELSKCLITEEEKIKVGMVVSDIFSGKVVKNIVSLSDTRDLQVVYPGDQKEDLRKVSIRSGRRELIFGVVDFKSSQQKIDDHLSDIFGRMTKIVDLPPTDELWGLLEIVKRRISKGYLGCASAAVMPIPISVMVTRYVKEEEKVKAPEHVRYIVTVNGVEKGIILSTETHPDQIRDAISKIYVDVAEEYSGAKQMAIDEALSSLSDPTFFINGQYTLWGAERVFLTVECVDVQQWDYKDCDVNLMYPFDVRRSTLRNFGEAEVLVPVHADKGAIEAADIALRQFNQVFTPADDVDQIYSYTPQFDEYKLHPKLSDILLRDWLIKRYDVQTEEKPHWDTRPGNVCLGLPTKGIDIYEISQMSVGFYDTLTSGRRTGKNTALKIYAASNDFGNAYAVKKGNIGLGSYVTHRGEITYKGKTVKVVFTAADSISSMVKKIGRRADMAFGKGLINRRSVTFLLNGFKKDGVDGVSQNYENGISVHVYKAV